MSVLMVLVMYMLVIMQHHLMGMLMPMTLGQM